jgi:hypothetical protein
MEIEKTFEFTLSHRFPNGDIASVKFGTRENITNILADAKPKELIKLENELAEKVYEDTMSDLKKAVKESKIIKEIWRGMKAAVKSQKDERDAEKILDKLSDDA